MVMASRHYVESVNQTPVLVPGFFMFGIMFRMNGISRYESRDGLGRAKQDARAESTWMCGAIALVLHCVPDKNWWT